MKFYLSILALFTAVATAASLPAENGLEIRRSTEALGGFHVGEMEIKDEEHFGDVVFHGTAQSIHEQMKALKPELFADDRTANETETSEFGESSSLVERQSYQCNWNQRPVDSERDCSEGLRYLRRFPHAQCGVGRGTCSRVSCSWNCGMWLCNKRNAHHWVYCSSLARDVSGIVAHCGKQGTRHFSSHYIGLRWDAC